MSGKASVDKQGAQGKQTSQKPHPQKKKKTEPTKQTKANSRDAQATTGTAQKTRGEEKEKEGRKNERHPNTCLCRVVALPTFRTKVHPTPTALTGSLSLPPSPQPTTLPRKPPYNIAPSWLFAILTRQPTEKESVCVRELCVRVREE